MKFQSRPPKDQKLINVIKHYKGLRARKPDIWIEHTTSQKNLKDAIVISTLHEKTSLLKLRATVPTYNRI